MSDHPFRYAYPISKGNLVDASQVVKIIDFVFSDMEVYCDPPEVWIVGHDHMQEAAKRVPHYREDGVVYGWFTPKYPDKVFISDRMKIRDKKFGAVLAHEIVHYVQNQKNDNREMNDLEQEADEVMMRYFKG